MIYVVCKICSYNNVAKGIRLLDKKKQQHFLFLQEKIMQVRAFERYIPLNRAVFYYHIVHNCDYRIVQTFVVIMQYSDYTFI